MKVLIVIPSKARAYDQKTIKWLRDCDLPENVDYKVFVEPQEKIHYKSVLTNKEIVVLEENNKGIGYVKTISHKYAKEKGYDLIFHMDDDVSGFIDKRAKAEFKVEVFNNIIRDLPKHFESNKNLFLIRFLSSKSFYYVKNLEQDFVYKNQGAWGCYITRIEESFYDENIKNYEDTLFQIQCWEKGFHSLTYGKAGISVDVYTNKGGFQSRDRRKDAEDTIEYLKSKYPKVRLKESGNTLGYDIDMSDYMLAQEKLF